MKTSNILLMAGLSLSLTATQKTFSQSGNSLRFKVPAQPADTSSRTGADDRETTSSNAAVNSKAIAHFHQTYTSATDEKWSATPDGSRVRFVSEGIRTIESYNQRGKWVGTIRYLSVEQVPSDVAQEVAYLYPDYKIFFAEDVRTAYGFANIVKIETASNWKMLKIADGNVEVMEDLDK